VVGVERKTGCLGEESLDCNAGFEASKGRADTEVEAATECIVGSIAGAVDVVVRDPELVGRRTVGSGPEQEYAAVRGDVHVPEGGIGGGASVVELERTVLTEDVLERLRDMLGAVTEPSLQINRLAKLRLDPGTLDFSELFLPEDGPRGHYMAPDVFAKICAELPAYVRAFLCSPT
jgi:hypothetical protein